MDFSAAEDLSSYQLNALLQQIGNTPMLPITMKVNGETRNVFLKWEGANPTGSMKDRTGYALIHHLEVSGVLNEQTTIIESTSGNLGVALALICKAKGYRFIAVVDPKTTQENITKMRILDAQIEMVDQCDANGGYLLSRLARVQQLSQSSKNYIWTNQYSNPANPDAHYTGTGPEIYQQMNGEVDVIFVPVSTGGTLAGIGRFFREVKRSTRIIGVDAYGSVVFSSQSSPRKLTGIGSSQRSKFIHDTLYDMSILVRDAEAFAVCRKLYHTLNVRVGGSSGAVLAACGRYLLTHRDVSNVVCVCADRGENYLSSIFDDAWLQAQGLEISDSWVENDDIWKNEL